jgi:hypothetical protein
MPVTNERVSLYIEPPSRHFLNDRLFEDDTTRLNGDRQNAPYAHIRETLAQAGVPVRTADYLPRRPDDTLKIYVSLGDTKKFARLRSRPDVVLSAFFAMECPIVEPRLYRAFPQIAKSFRRLFSWSDSDALRPFTRGDFDLRPFRWPQSFDDVHESSWRRTNRKFLVMINANKLPRVYWNELYTERMRALEFFGRSAEVDLYGKGWDGPSLRVGYTRVPSVLKRRWLTLLRQWDRIRPAPLLAAARRAYKGPAPTKLEVLEQYDFALCFENCILRGWITEKLFDCFFAGTVPIYWGAPEIAEIVPPDCFIDMRRFAGYAELRRFLRSLSPKDIAGYRNRAREFLRSPGYRPFARDAFTRKFCRILIEDAPGVAARVRDTLGSDPTPD